VSRAPTARAWIAAVSQTSPHGVTSSRRGRTRKKRFICELLAHWMGRQGGKRTHFVSALSLSAASALEPDEISELLAELLQEGWLTIAGTVGESHHQYRPAIPAGQEWPRRSAPH